MTLETQTPDAIYAFDIRNEIEIAASIEVTFEAMLDQLGPGGEMPDGTPFPFKLEAWPGGRWYRDLGNNAGHLWGHVQVIKPPTLLEIVGPMPMSYPAINHLQYRLKAEGDKTAHHPPPPCDGVDHIRASRRHAEGFRVLAAGHSQAGGAEVSVGGNDRRRPTGDTAPADIKLRVAAAAGIARPFKPRSSPGSTTR